MKHKLNLLLFLLGYILCCFDLTTQASPNDSLKLVSIGLKIDSLTYQQRRIVDTLKNIKNHVNTDTSASYIADQSAIDQFNKQKDSIYKASNFLFLNCKKCSKTKINNCKQNFFSCFILTISILILLWMWYFGINYFRTRTLCKDDSTVPSVSDRPYSFARVQLFWWTMIILSLYIYFFAFTGILVPFNMTSVILLGAGVLVYSGGKIIDKRQQIALGGKTPEFKTEGLLNDLMSDETGISIHRFQTIIFNLVFGIEYIILFFKNVTNCNYPFPDFDAWQFALLGISAAAYLGNKTSENAPNKFIQNNSSDAIITTEEPTVRDIQNH